MHRIAARFKHAGVFVALTAPFLTLSVASPAMAATPLAVSPLAASPLTATSRAASLSITPLAADFASLATDSASDDNIWLTIAIVAVGIALMSCIALALTVAKARRNRAKINPWGRLFFRRCPLRRRPLCSAHQVSRSRWPLRRRPPRLVTAPTLPRRRHWPLQSQVGCRLLHSRLTRFIRSVMGCPASPIREIWLRFRTRIRMSSWPMN